MTVLLVVSLILNVIWLGVIWFLWDEVRQRGRHLKWVDERDQGVVHLFQKVGEARVAPMSNPLDGMKQHGLISRNAVSPVYLQEMDERLNEPETWKTTPSGQRLPDATPAETMEALGGTGGGLAIGEGAFGEEVQ